MDETLKWRCGICGAEFLTENPPTDAEDALMHEHVLSHREQASVQTKNEIEIAILERWYKLEDPR